jgi:hypothetical protein
MHPVSHRGRSMSRDRQAVRALYLVLGILCWSLTTGCLRSTMLQQGGPSTQPASATGPLPGNQAASSSGSGTPAAGGSGTSVRAPSASPAGDPPAGPGAPASTELQAAPTSLQDQATLAPLTPQPAPTSPPVTASASEATAGEPTPLLDAAIERVQAVTRQQHDSVDSAAPSSEPDNHARSAVAPAAPAVVSPVPVQQASAPLLLVDTPESSASAAPKGIKSIDSPTQPVIPTIPTDKPQQIGAETQPKTPIVPRTASAAPTHETPPALPGDPEPVPPAGPTVADDVNPLSIGKLCLCRKILGFGSFEPLNESRVKTGQRVLLYCEMTGMQYEEKDGSFVSRLSSKIEIGSVENGVFQWSRELGPAEDVCASRRHDFFVNYRFCVPQNLPPGTYRLRLTQTDLVANRSTSSEIPLEILP